MKTENDPFIYLWIYKKMCDKWGRNCNTVVYSKDVIEIIRRTVYQIPKKYDYYILKELERYNFVETINQQKCKILGLDSQKRLKRVENYCFWIK